MFQLKRDHKSVLVSVAKRFIHVCYHRFRQKVECFKRFVLSEIKETLLLML